MHSSDSARRSLCMFSSSFFTASGLWVPDMVHYAESISARRKRSPALSPRRGDRQPPPGASGPAAAPLRLRRGLGQRTPSVPERPPQPPRNSPDFSSRRPRRPPAPLDSAGAGRGAHKAGESLPRRRDPATPGVTKQSGQRLQRRLPKPPRLADAISRVAHNSERGRYTSAALPGTAATAPVLTNPNGEQREGRGWGRGHAPSRTGRTGFRRRRWGRLPITRLRTYGARGTVCFTFLLDERPNAVTATPWSGSF